MFEIILFKKNRLILLDQRKLPRKIKYVKIKNSYETFRAIKDMVVRGAPAIGIAAAYGFCLGYLEKKTGEIEDLIKHMNLVKKELLKSRPTAVNLKWALDKMDKEFNSLLDLNRNQIFEKLVKAADKIKDSEIQANKRIGQYGAEILKELSKQKGKLTLLTHCNAGALATGGWGTALGVVRSAFKEGIIKMIYADETRPRLQGARLTCFELKKELIPYTLICDNMSGLIMKNNKIDAVIVGADRIASNGDVANKIGTYMVAVLADRHHIPFYVAAPESTFDFDTQEGGQIEIELRSKEEVLGIGKNCIAPEDTNVENFAFDITPCELVSAYITEKGVVYRPQDLRSFFKTQKKEKTEIEL